MFADKLGWKLVLERRPVTFCSILGHCTYNYAHLLKLRRWVNDRRYVFHFRPKPNIWPEKHLALGRIPKPKPNVQIYVKIGGLCISCKQPYFFLPYGSFFLRIVIEFSRCNFWSKIICLAICFWRCRRHLFIL